MLLTLVLSLLTCVSCSEETLDYNNPDVDLFVRQLKAGNYNTKSPKGFVEVPKFTEKDIPTLLNYAEDLTLITSFRFRRCLLIIVARSAWVNVCCGLWKPSG